MVMEKLRENVAYKVAHDNSLVREVANAVIDDLDYSAIASMLAICNSDVADEIDTTEVLSDIVDHLDMDDLREAVVDKCDMDEIADKVVSMLPVNFMDDLAILAAEEIIAEISVVTATE
jgi:thymidine phosphorylase